MLEFIKNTIWTFPCFILIVLTGGILLFKIRFHFFKIKLDKKAFSLMCTSLGGTIGVGNAIGVAGAISEGGAGAVFWMLVAGLFSMVIKYAEIFLSLTYKEKGKNFGAVGYIKEGVSSPFFALLYAFLAVLVSLGMGNISQMKAGIVAFNNAVNIPIFIITLIFTLLIVFTVLGGLKKIRTFAEIAVPVFSFFYIGFLIVILFLQREKLPFAIKEIFKGSGFFAGIKWSIIKSGISNGFSKSVFSSEAGLGSAGFTHGESDLKPYEQGLWGIVEVFIDSFICIITAIAILSAPSFILNNDASAMTMSLFVFNFGRAGELFYGISMLFFAFSSIICWYYNGSTAVRYITEKKSIKIYYLCVFAFLLILAPFLDTKVILDISDIANGLMMIVNLSAVLILIKKIKTD